MCICCIFCKVDEQNSKLSKEHIIPQTLGGFQTLPYVCKKHNNDFGTNFESKLKKNIFIVKALDNLRIKPKKIAYDQAEFRIDLLEEKNLVGFIDKNEDVKFRTQKYKNEDTKEEHLVVSNEQIKTTLKKQIKRYETEHEIEVKFDVDKEFDSLPFDIAIPIYPTDINFIKRKNSNGRARILGLDNPIPFEVIAKIALLHLSFLFYPLAMVDELDQIKEFILNGGENYFVMIHSFLREEDPDELNYLPFHSVRISLIDDSLVALVNLFGTMTFSVVLGDFKKVTIKPPQDVSELFDKYFVYDLEKKEIFLGDIDIDNYQTHTFYLEDLVRTMRFEKGG
ncbi:MAG: HNH endonuclease [Calditrichaeota bacterium]|nr:MAG: HNH endonuclease [Calditrichota bacterium]